MEQKKAFSEAKFAFEFSLSCMKTPAEDFFLIQKEEFHFYFAPKYSKLKDH